MTVSERLRCAECGGQLHSVKPWRMEDMLASRLGARVVVPRHSGQAR